MVTVNLNPDVADAAKDAVRRTVAELAKDNAHSDGLPYKAAHHLYQLGTGKISHDQAWRATQNAIKDMIDHDELFAPIAPHEDWKLKP
jgi:hypothetical protein